MFIIEHMCYFLTLAIPKHCSDTQLWIHTVVMVYVDFTEKRVIHLIALSFGVLCMVQAILNISLRVTCEYGFICLLYIYFFVIWNDLILICRVKTMTATSL